MLWRSEKFGAFLESLLNVQDFEKLLTIIKLYGQTPLQHFCELHWARMEKMLWDACESENVELVVGILLVYLPKQAFFEENQDRLDGIYWS